MLKADEKSVKRSLAWDPLPSKCLESRWSRKLYHLLLPSGAYKQTAWDAVRAQFYPKSPTLPTFFITTEVRATGWKSLRILGLFDLETGTTTASFQTCGTCCSYKVKKHEIWDSPCGVQRLTPASQHNFFLYTWLHRLVHPGFVIWEHFNLLRWYNHVCTEGNMRTHHISQWIWITSTGVFKHVPGGAVAPLLRA